MAFTVRWTNRASNDLVGIEAYIAKDNVPAARREVADVIRQAEVLAAFPKLGPVYRRVFGQEFRSVLTGKYRIIYVIRAGESAIDIVTVRHGAQDQPELP